MLYAIVTAVIARPTASLQGAISWMTRSSLTLNIDHAAIFAAVNVLSVCRWALLTSVVARTV